MPRPARREKRKTCDRCRATKRKLICDGLLPCRPCTERNKPCHFSTSTLVSGSAPVDGRGFINKSRVDVLAAGGEYRTENRSDLGSAGRVATFSRLSVEYGNRGRSHFNTLVENWQALPPDRGKSLPEIAGQLGPSTSVDGAGAIKASEEDNESVAATSRSGSPENQGTNTAIAPGRFKLPSSGLLDAIHVYASEMYTKRSEQNATQSLDSTHNLFHSMNGSALLAFGVLAQEYMRNLTPMGKNNQLKPEQCQAAPSIQDVVGSAPLTIAATDRQRRQHTYVYKRRGTTIQSKDIDNEWDADNDLSEGDELDNDHSDNGDGG